MNIKRIPIEKIELNTGQIEGLPANPRQWTRDDIDRIAASLKETPELFEMRPCIVYPLEGGQNSYSWQATCVSAVHVRTR